MRKRSPRFREVLRLNPQHRTARQSLVMVLVNAGTLLSNQGRHEEAVARFREALRLNPQHQTAMMNIASVRMNQGRYAAGLAAAQQVIARYPDDAQAHHLAGFGLFHLNRKADALRHYDRALALDPNLTLAREQRKRFFAPTTSEGRQ